MAKKLFIGSLPFEITNEKLEELFSQAGKVESANVVTDKFSGRSRGFGFVEMSSDEEAEKAIETLNGYEIEGRKIVVSEARPREEFGERRGGGGSGGFKPRARSGFGRR